MTVVVMSVEGSEVRPRSLKHDDLPCSGSATGVEGGGGGGGGVLPVGCLEVM